MYGSPFPVIGIWNDIHGYVEGQLAAFGAALMLPMGSTSVRDNYDRALEVDMTEVKHFS